MSKSLILCDCSGSQQLDSEALEKATGLSCSGVHTALCTTQVESAAKAIASGDAMICCAQEWRLFEEIAAEIEAPAPAFLDLRDRAGWSADKGSKLPKMSALAAEAMLPVPAEKTMDVVSEGLCLVIGASDIVLPAAEKLAENLSVTALLTDDAEPPLSRAYDALRGRLRRVSGSLGAFEVVIDGLQQIDPTGRALSWTEPRDGGKSACDVIVDLSGEAALFPAPEKRDGYLRADPKHAPSVADALLEASQMIGTFEKPLYVKLEPLLCAHSRAEKTACTNCLDICPTSAIASAGEHVSIDPAICAGCGACAALCPSGAISYDAPSGDFTFRRIQALAEGYAAGGGQGPRLLVHDAHGREMIELAARFGDGLPADVVPVEMSAISAFGHAEMLAALAAGFADVTLLASPKMDTEAATRELALTEAIAPAKAKLLDVSDPDAMSAALFTGDTPQPIAQPALSMGTRRQITRNAAKALNPEAEMIALPEDAPYGAVLVNTDACTLCLSCVALCPSGALGENEDLPQLRFQEDACLQCGLCSTICPEDAIAYEPRLNLTNSALEQQILNEEEPFACVECGSLFGVKSTIERITEKLAGKHHMFATSDAARMIQMCDDCRVNAQYHAENNPFAAGERPKPRTTDDYFSKRKDH